MDLTAKWKLIKRGLYEILGEEKILAVMQERNLKLYWGTATSGKPHIGYFVPMLKIADFLAASVEVTILLADIHAFLDSEKSSWETLEHRAEYYKKLILSMLSSIGVETTRIRFVKGSDFQLSKEYAIEVYKLTTKTKVHAAQRAGTETVKQAGDPLLSSLLYPGMQALDEVFLEVDAQFGGLDQRKIFIYAEKMLPLLGHTKRAHLMNPLIPGMEGEKMSSSEKESKIDLLDSSETVTRRIKKAFCPIGIVDKNAPLFLFKTIIFPSFTHRGVSSFTIQRQEKHGGNLIFSSYEDLEKTFLDGSLHPLDLKMALAAQLNLLLDPIRSDLSTEYVTSLLEKGYPAETNPGNEGSEKRALSGDN